MSRPASYRYPFAPLEERAIAAHGVGRNPHGPVPGDTHYSDAVLALMLGVTRRQIARWKNDGIPEPAADRAVIALGVHPVELWGDEWFHDVEAGAA